MLNPIKTTPLLQKKLTNTERFTIWCGHQHLRYLVNLWKTELKKHGTCLWNILSTTTFSTTGNISWCGLSDLISFIVMWKWERMTSETESSQNSPLLKLQIFYPCLLEVVLSLQSYCVCKRHSIRHKLEEWALHLFRMTLNKSLRSAVQLPVTKDTSLILM